MSTLAPPVESVAKELVKTAEVNSPFWRIAIVVATNCLAVPLAIPLIYLPPGRPHPYATLCWLMLIGAFHGHLFLLAYWMTFGGTPKFGRRLIATFLAIFGAAPIAAMMAHRAIAAIDKDFEFGWNELPAFGPLVIGPVMISVIVVWSLQAALMLPQHFARVVINFEELKLQTPIPSRRISALSILGWIVMAATPPGLSLLLYFVDPVFAQRMSIQVIISTLFGVIALTPAALLLVTENNLGWKLVASASWALIVIILFLLFPPQWAPEDTVTVHFATCVTVILNLLILRALGLRWLPTTPTSPAAAE